eukprot:9464191-Pyramimonas_sp.AAC.1
MGSWTFQTCLSQSAQNLSATSCTSAATPLASSPVPAPVGPHVHLWARPAPFNVACFAQASNERQRAFSNSLERRALTCCA